MQKKYSLFIFSLLMGIGMFFSCETDTTNGNGLSGKVVEKDGYQYVYHIQNNGPLPQPTEYALYRHTMRADDSLLMDSRDLNLISKMEITALPPEGSKKPRPQPILAGLRTMSVGDSITIKIPMDSLPQIPIGFSKYKYLNYDIVLVGIKTQEQIIAESTSDAKKIEARRRVDMARVSDIAASLRQTIKDYKSGKLDNRLKETSSGLKYIIHEEGKGKTPKPGSPLRIHYYGMLMDGTAFDNSFQRGNPLLITLDAGQVIKGWNEAIKLMNIGSKATLFVPSSLGYGEAGSPPAIPPNAELAFYIELFYPYGD
jgi:FKBP-type peptidyl-prolyl cis-trans isomerase